MEEHPYALHGGDRKRLDTRRVCAALLDCLVFLPLELVARQYDLGAELLVTAMAFVYFYVADVTTGQTIGKSVLGLRTVTTDGELPGPWAAARRTGTRLIDHTPLGLIVMVCSGRRRQRIGDLLAGTVVVEADDVVPAPRVLRLSLLRYPAMWMVPALVAFFAYADGRAGGSYRGQADAVCAEAQSYLASVESPEQVALVLAEEERILRSLDPPANWSARHQALVTEVKLLRGQAEAAAAELGRDPQGTGWARVVAQGQAAGERIAANGFRDCSSAAPQLGAAPAPA